MMQSTSCPEVYSTGEIASLVGVHVNTIRFYEEIGFITKPERKANGYRCFTQLQLDQCRLIRRAMKAEVLQNGLRKKAVDIVRLCAVLEFEGAKAAGTEYCFMLEAELKNARAAIRAVEDILHRETPAETPGMRRQDAAKSLCVTAETLRTWERSGLVTVKRSANGCRIYDSEDMQRLNIIRTLRCANYSLCAILRLMDQLDRDASCRIEAALNIPRTDEDIVSVCDRLIISLQNTLEDAKALLPMIDEMAKKNNPTVIHQPPRFCYTAEETKRRA